jgi:eight-cysteine-cluster-containing protein
MTDRQGLGALTRAEVFGRVGARSVRFARRWCGASSVVLLALVALGCSACNSTPDANTPPSVTVPTASAAPAGAGGSAAGPAPCQTGGCSGELCQEPGSAAPSFTTCEYKREYDCYKTAICGRDTSGQCNWELTPELEKCLKVSR